MRTKYRIINRMLFIALLIFAFGCNDILEEEPKTLFTTAYFETPQGIQDAVNAAYAYQRLIYAPVGALALFNQGTDEWTFGEQPATNTSGDNLQHREAGDYSITSNNGAIGSVWYGSFPAINLCNAIVEYAPNVPALLDSQKNVIIGEARFLRALNYYNLVSQFGAVPVDLGSGDLQVNTVPYFGFNRLPLDEVLAKDYQAMIDDLTYASEHLPMAKQSDSYKLSQAAALHLLAKVYLARSYSDVAQDGDVQNAYNAAKKLVENRTMYGVDLLPDFADVFRQGNDYNSEILYAVERIPMNNINNEYVDPSTDFANKVNIANNLFIPNYQQSIGGVVYINSRPMEYQRPLRKIAPTQWLLRTAFDDKENDTRYHKSFRTLYRSITINEPGTQAYDEYLTYLADLGKNYGDTAWYMPDTQEEADALIAQNVNYNVVGPDDWYTNQNNAYIMHPALKKYDDTLRANFNDVSGRPFPVFRLAETYLLYAEAAMLLGLNDEAAVQINVLKRRAAFDRGLSQSAIDARYALIAVDASDITLDFILDERSRELAGESLRWADLALRKKLYERAIAHNPDVVGLENDATGTKYLVRPIPQGQLDAVNDPNRQQYQNPGF